MKECHCGKDGHPLHSVNCPKHGKESQLEMASQYLYFCMNGSQKMWDELPRSEQAYWRAAAAAALEGAEEAQK